MSTVGNKNTEHTHSFILTFAQGFIHRQVWAGLGRVCLVLLLACCWKKPSDVITPPSPMRERPSSPGPVNQPACYPPGPLHDVWRRLLPDTGLCYWKNKDRRQSLVSWESHDLRSASREGLYWYIYTTYLVKILWFVGKIREASGRRVLVSGLRRRSDENPMKSFIRKVEKERRYRVEKELRHCQISMKRQILKVTDLYRSSFMYCI